MVRLNAAANAYETLHYKLLFIKNVLMREQSHRIEMVQR